jgi:hypothetical protein
VVDTDLTISRWNSELAANINYLTVAGADLASATTITPTNEFHGVTGTTTIANLSPASPVAGQQVRLWIKAGPLTIQNQGGGTGNVRLLAGVDRVCNQNEVVVFVYDGTVWREARTEVPGTELDYAQITAAVASIVVTSEGTSQAIITGNSVTYDGLKVLLTFECGGYDNTGSNVGTIVFYRDAVVIGQVLIGSSFRGTLPLVVPCFDTPPAGAHTYKVAVFVAAGSGTIYAGAGGSGAKLPAFLRVTKA